MQFPPYATGESKDLSRYVPEFEFRVCSPESLTSRMAIRTLGLAAIIANVSALIVSSLNKELPMTDGIGETSSSITSIGVDRVVEPLSSIAAINSSTKQMCHRIQRGMNRPNQFNASSVGSIV